MISEENINEILEDLFPLCRSLTGEDNIKTIRYIIENILEGGDIKYINSGEKVFDWEVPPEWNIRDAYVKNKFGNKIIDFKKNNIHLVSYSMPYSGVLEKNELLKHLYTLPDRPNTIPYRTSYYKKDWGFCCSENLLNSDSFEGPFEVYIDSDFNDNGKLNWYEFLKKGKSDKEILISTYLCHPSLANDNLSGIVLSSILVHELKKIDTYYSYRLVIVPETIGAICFLSKSSTENIVGGMIITCVGGPEKLSIKEGFDSNHWINKSAHYALNKITNGDYIKYPFVPNGSDERQYSSPGFRIITPSIHKSKYYEYEEYHTSDDNLNFISSKNILESLSVYIKWIQYIESYCFPERILKSCEFQLGKRGLYPNLGGTLNQPEHHENKNGHQKRVFNVSNLTGSHLDAFDWLMHLCDGKFSNFQISEISGIDIDIINESIELFEYKELLKTKR